MNPELSIPALDAIWFHFNEYYVMDEDVLPPLNFKKITQVKDFDAVLVVSHSLFIFNIISEI